MNGSGAITIDDIHMDGNKAMASIDGTADASSIFIGIDYDDRYKAVTVERGGQVRRYASGDPVADWRDACAEAGRLARKHECLVMTLSSCTHFVMDVEGWRFDENDELQADETSRPEPAGM